MQTTRLSVGTLTVLSLLVVGCLCRPQDDKPAKDGVKPMEGAIRPTTASSRTSRLQKPTQVLNTGYDEIVVESNLQVHNRVGSKNKSKIMLPSNSTTTATSAPTNKSARSLVVWSVRIRHWNFEMTYYNDNNNIPLSVLLLFTISHAQRFYPDDIIFIRLLFKTCRVSICVIRSTINTANMLL